MITAIVLGTFGLFGALIGVQCSKAGGDNIVLKGRIAGTAGVFFLLQGNKDKREASKNEEKYILGELTNPITNKYTCIPIKTRERVQMMCTKKEACVIAR